MLKFHPRIAPVKAAIFPLVKRDGMPEKAEAIYRELKRNYHVFYDEKGAIGRRYRRQDEAGTPFCITIDSQSLTDETVTIRDRDSCRQWRVAAAGVIQGDRRIARGSSHPGERRGARPRRRVVNRCSDGYISAAPHLSCGLASRPR